MLVPWHVYISEGVSCWSLYQHPMGMGTNLHQYNTKIPCQPLTAPAYLYLTCHHIVPALLPMPIQLAYTER